MFSTADVVVVGGGCSGTSIAAQLAQRGAGRVVLLEKHSLASGATGWSSAIIRTHYTHATLARMALCSRGVFEHFNEVIGGQADFRRTGFLVLVGPDDTAALSADVAMHREVGIDARVLAPHEIGIVEPRLTLEGVGAAAWEPDSGYADPHGTTTGYAQAARRNGAEICTGVTVSALGMEADGIAWLDTDAGRIVTNTVVVAAGYHTRALLAPLGVDVPLTPVRHTIAILRRTASFGSTHPIISDRVLGSYYRPEGSGMTMIGTTGAHDGQTDPDIERTPAPKLEDETVLVERFCQRFPGEEDAAIQRGYTGVYDCSPDLQPILGPVPGIEGLHIAVGFSGHGFKLSPAVGELVAEQIVDGGTSLVDIGLFGLGRFAANQPITAPYGYTAATLG